MLVLTVVVDRDVELGRALDFIGFLFFFFYDNVDMGNNDIHLVWVLVELWWDIANTFHFLIGEMTLTTIDFSMIIGLCYTGMLVEFSFDMVADGLTIKSLLGSLLL